MIKKEKKGGGVTPAKMTKKKMKFYRRERDICLRRLKLSLSCAIQVYHAELVLQL
jgi:hypothetical protein